MAFSMFFCIIIIMNYNFFKYNIQKKYILQPKMSISNNSLVVGSVFKIRLRS